jgi:hypothetical protein
MHTSWDAIDEHHARNPSTSACRARMSSDRLAFMTFRTACVSAAMVLMLPALHCGVAAADDPRPTATATSGGARAPVSATKLSAEQTARLEKAKFVYISSTRKDGTLGSPAEIWFAVIDGAVWVASAPDAWRVKRIRWGRPQAKIAIGSEDGPSLRATGQIVQDPDLYRRFCDQLGTKYPDRWPRWERSFREGLVSGERVLIRYSPVSS